MARHRLGIVLLVTDPVASGIDGIRLALGDNALGRIPAHITLVPPVNVRERDLAAAFDLVHESAARCPPLRLGLGPVLSFWPVTPVAYLAVSGRPGDLARLGALKDSLHAGPLHRPEDHRFIPHVTVAAELSEDRLAAAVTALAEYQAEVLFERVHVLAEQPGRIWIPVADVLLSG